MELVDCDKQYFLSILPYLINLQHILYLKLFMAYRKFGMYLKVQPMF